jgi:hypothetical protein
LEAVLGQGEGFNAAEAERMKVFREEFFSILPLGFGTSAAHDGVEEKRKKGDESVESRCDNLTDGKRSRVSEHGSKQICQIGK